MGTMNATKSSPAKGARSRLRRDQRGAIMVEYLVVISTVTIGFAIAVLAIGPYLVADYERSQAAILSPFP